jgi:hypothetical protein
MKTFFKGNAFETINEYKYYEEKDTLLNNVMQTINLSIIENIITKGDILPNGLIKVETQCTKQVNPI